MLEFDLVVQPDAADGAPVFLLLHGRGANGDDLRPLAAALPSDALLVLPDAPFPAAPWGYGPGRAWYRFLGDRRPDPESFARSLDEVDTLIRDLPARLPVRPGPLVLGGFSQGGTVSLAFALAHPGRIPMVLSFSGFLAEHARVAITAATVRGTAIFWGHGLHDPAIPFDWARQGRAALAAVGADLQARDYPIGHWIEPRELRDAMDWVGRRLPAKRRTGGEPIPAPPVREANDHE